MKLSPLDRSSLSGREQSKTRFLTISAKALFMPSLCRLSLSFPTGMESPIYVSYYLHQVVEFMSLCTDGSHTGRSGDLHRHSLVVHSRDDGA